MLVLVDGSNLSHRSLHACKRDLGYYSYKDGIIYFLRSLGSMLKKQNLEAGVIIAWDKGIPLHRRELLSEYKPHCTPVGDVCPSFLSSFNKGETESDEFNSGFIQEYSKLVKILHNKILPLCNCISLRVENVEADDIIAYCCYHLKDQDKLISSSDRDLLQLVSDTTSVYNFNSPNPNSNLYDEEWIFNTYQSIDNFRKLFLIEKAILGDGADNIQGIELVGSKSAGHYATQIVNNMIINNMTLEQSIESVERPPRASKKGHENLKNSVDLIKRNINIMDLYYPIEVLKEHKMSYNIQKQILQYSLVNNDYDTCMDSLEELEELQFNNIFSTIDKIYESNCNFDMNTVLETIKSVDN